MTGFVVSAPRYASAALPRRHRPPKARPYAEYRECLRLEFGFNCVYCLSTETEVGPGDNFGGFEIEHFRPKGLYRFKHLKSFYKNLLWSCKACNRAKGDRWPSDEETKLGMQFVDPCVEGLSNHLELRGDRVAPVGSSAAGQYMIDEINLNSAQHIKRRQRREELLRNIGLLDATWGAVKQRVVPGAPDEAAILAELAAIEEGVEKIKVELGLDGHPPWDAPSSCRCPPARP